MFISPVKFQRCVGSVLRYTEELYWQLMLGQDFTTALHFGDYLNLSSVLYLQCPLNCIRNMSLRIHRHTHAHTHKLSMHLLLPSNPVLSPRRESRVSLLCSPVLCWQTTVSSSTHQTCPHPNPYRPELTSSNPHQQTPSTKTNLRARLIE